MERNKTFTAAFEKVHPNGQTYAWEVVVHPDKNHGYFEGYNVTKGEGEFHVEGCLWFEGKVLVDYDGVFCLPDEVDFSLQSMGYDTSEL
jgi:hypothetical protein